MRGRAFCFKGGLIDHTSNHDEGYLRLLFPRIDFQGMLNILSTRSHRSVANEWVVGKYDRTREFSLLGMAMEIAPLGLTSASRAVIYDGIRRKDVFPDEYMQGDTSSNILYRVFDLKASDRILQIVLGKVKWGYDPMFDFQPRALAYRKGIACDISGAIGSIRRIAVSAIHLCCVVRVYSENEQSSNFNKRLRLFPPALFCFASNLTMAVGWLRLRLYCTRTDWIVSLACSFGRFCLSVACLFVLGSYQCDSSISYYVSWGAVRSLG